MSVETVSLHPNLHTEYYPTPLTTMATIIQRVGRVLLSPVGSHEMPAAITTPGNTHPDAIPSEREAHSMHSTSGSSDSGGSTNGGNTSSGGTSTRTGNGEQGVRELEKRHERIWGK
jgi:uncharacterized membrane protein YgcG